MLAQWQWRTSGAALPGRRRVGQDDRHTCCRPSGVHSTNVVLLTIIKLDNREYVKITFQALHSIHEITLSKPSSLFLIIVCYDTLLLDLRVCIYQINGFFRHHFHHIFSPCENHLNILKIHVTPWTHFMIAKVTGRPSSWTQVLSKET